MLGRSFKSDKCKTSLRLVLSRIKVSRNGRNSQVQKLKREVAELLQSGQDIGARVKVEHVIREENALAAYDLVSLYCELIVARLSVIESQKTCPIDLKEAISSIIFASPRCADVSELSEVSKQLRAKYGKEFITSVLELRPKSGVSEMLVAKLSSAAPDIDTKLKVLSSIASEHGIEWEPQFFGEQLQMPHEDFLDGPSSLESATKITQEHTKFEPVAQTSQKPEPTIATSKNGAISSVTNFHSDYTSGVLSMEHVPTPRSPEQGWRDIRGTAYQQNHSMDFKDAASAAWAAAGSANMASMAAKVAVELAFRENISGESITESDEYVIKTSVANMESMAAKASVEVASRENISGESVTESDEYVIKTSVDFKQEPLVDPQLMGDSAKMNASKFSESENQHKQSSLRMRPEYRDSAIGMSRSNRSTSSCSVIDNEMEDEFTNGNNSAPVYDDCFDDNDHVDVFDFLNRNSQEHKKVQESSESPQQVKFNRQDACLPGHDAISPLEYDDGCGFDFRVEHSPSSRPGKQELKPSISHRGKVEGREVNRESPHLSPRSFHDRRSSSGKSSTDSRRQSAQSFTSNDPHSMDSETSYNDEDETGDMVALPYTNFQNRDSEESEGGQKLGNLRGGLKNNSHLHSRLVRGTLVESGVSKETRSDPYHSENPTFSMLDGNFMDTEAHENMLNNQIAHSFSYSSSREGSQQQWGHQGKVYAGSASSRSKLSDDFSEVPETKSASRTHNISQCEEFSNHKPPQRSHPIGSKESSTKTLLPHPNSDVMLGKDGAVSISNKKNGDRTFIGMGARGHKSNNQIPHSDSDSSSSEDSPRQGRAGNISNKKLGDTILNPKKPTISGRQSKSSHSEVPSTRLKETKFRSSQASHPDTDTMPRVSVERIGTRGVPRRTWDLREESKARTLSEVRDEALEPNTDTSRRHDSKAILSASSTKRRSFPVPQTEDLAQNESLQPPLHGFAHAIKNSKVMPSKASEESSLSDLPAHKSEKRVPLNSSHVDIARTASSGIIESPRPPASLSSVNSIGSPLATPKGKKLPPDYDELSTFFQSLRSNRH